MQSTLEAIPNVSATGSAFSARWNNALLAAVVLVGTGGAPPKTINYVPSAIVHPWTAGTSDSIIDSDRMLDAQEKLAGIRRYLSLTVTDLAKVLRVGRPTIYSWLRDTANLRAEHAQRLEAVYRLARKWRTISSRPVGSFLNQPLASGVTPLSLLSAKSLNEMEIQSAFVQLQDAHSRTVPRRGVAEVAKQRGFKLATIREPKNWSSNEDFDV